MTRNLSSAYSLIDVMICLALVAMVTALATPNLLKKRTAAEFAQARMDMQNLKVGLEAYRLEQLSYPWMNSVNSALAGGNVQVWAVPTLERLSTPIAYISGNPFYDPFQATHTYFGSDLESVSDTTAAPHLEPAFKQYFYHARNAIDTSTWGQVVGDQQPLWYLLESAGPDKHHHRMAQALSGSSSNSEEKVAMRSKAVYDPTNGLVSRGSIWEVGGEPQGTGSTFATAVQNANSSRVAGWQEYRGK